MHAISGRQFYVCISFQFFICFFLRAMLFFHLTVFIHEFCAEKKGNDIFYWHFQFHIDSWKNVQTLKLKPPKIHTENNRYEKQNSKHARNYMPNHISCNKLSLMWNCSVFFSFVGSTTVMAIDWCLVFDGKYGSFFSVANISIVSNKSPFIHHGTERMTFL